MDDYRRAFVSRLLHIKNSGQFFIGHSDQINRLFSRLKGLCRNSCYGFAHIANHPPARHDGQILDHHSPYENCGCVPIRDHTPDPRNPLRLRGIYIQDLGMGIRTPQHLGVEHPGKLGVTTVRLFSQDLGLRIWSDNTFS